MPQINVNVGLEADDLAAAQKIVEGWKLPDGAIVAITAPQIVQGTIAKGKVKEPELHEIPEPITEE